MKQSLLPYCSIAFLFALSSSAARAGVIPSGRTVAPSGFEENKGQVLTTAGDAAPFVRYRLTQGNTSIFLLGNGIAYQFNRLHYAAGYEALEKDAHLDPTKQQELDSLRKDVRLETYRMDVVLEGANADASITTEGRSDDYTQYYNHNALDVHTYSRVTYHEVYPGIDWVVYTTEKGIEYDFVVRPDADPSQIQLRFKDQEELYVDADGQLVQGNRMGRFKEQPPESFQDGKKVDSRFKLNGDRLTFALGAYDHGQSLTIDPARIWGTYYGGASFDDACCCSVDDSGNVYLSGGTQSNSAIASTGHQNAYAGGFGDAFLVKFDSNGVRQWATYYGGAGDDEGRSCAVDVNGNVFLAGGTGSDSAIAVGGFQTIYGGTTDNTNAFADAFLVKFNASGVRQWGTYYGGTGTDWGNSCAVDASGNVYLAGYTRSDSAIAAGGHQNIFEGNQDAFLAKFNADGARQWGTYYGGTEGASGSSCTVDVSGNVYLAGWTSSDSAIAYEGYQNTLGGDVDAFLVKFNTSGIRQWGTYYGGALYNAGESCATDGDCNVYLAGKTDFESTITAGGHQNYYGGGDRDAFLVKYSPSGMRQWATFYGGSDYDDGESCVADVSGNVYLAGYTASHNAIASGGYQNTFGGYDDAFLVKFNTNGVRQWGTYYGGEVYSEGASCAVDGGNNVFMAGGTSSYGAIASGGYQNTYAGGEDAFLAKFDGLPGSNAGILSPEDRPSSFSLWPNPNAGDRFFLRTQGTGPAEVQIFDDLGQLQRTWHLQLTPDQAPVELTLGSDLAKGMYLVHCTLDGRSSTAPLMVQ